ncbi:MAG: LptF/LptG family permease [Acetobacter papayae]
MASRFSSAMSLTPRAPRYILLRYLSVTLFVRVMICCSVLVGLLEVLALLEQTTPILQRHLGVQGLMLYVGLRLPFLLSNTLPFAVLIGALVMLTQMTLASETAILRAAGLSTLGFYLRLAPITLVLGFMGVMIDDQIAPRSELALAIWWNRTDPTPENGHAFWFRDTSRIVHVGYAADGGARLGEVDIYTRDMEGRLTGTLHAAQASHTPAGGWILHDVSGLSVHNLVAQAQPTQANVPWAMNLPPAEIIRLAADRPPISTRLMIERLLGHVPSNDTPAYLKAGLLERLMRPISLLVLLLIAMPVLYIPPRTGSRSWLPVWCLGSGLLFIVTQGLFRAMGNAGLLPPLMAVLPGLIIFTLGALSALLRNETL